MDSLLVSVVEEAPGATVVVLSVFSSLLVLAPPAGLTTVVLFSVFSPAPGTTTVVSLPSPSAAGVTVVFSQALNRATSARGSSSFFIGLIKVVQVDNQYNEWHT